MGGFTPRHEISISLQLFYRVLSLLQPNPIPSLTFFLSDTSANVHTVRNVHKYISSEFHSRIACFNM